MRVAFVINQFPPSISSGLGRYVELIYPHLVGEHAVDVFTLNDGTQPEVDELTTGTVYRPRLRLLDRRLGRRRLNRTRRVDFLLLTLMVLVSNWRYVRRLRRLPAARRPDVVAVHDTTNFLCALLCHYALKLPVVLHVHTTEYGVATHRTIVDPLRLFAALERWLARIARRVIVATPETRDQLLTAGWPHKIDVIPLGGTFENVDLTQPRPGVHLLRRQLGLTGPDEVLLFVGRIERPKGVYPLLAALPAITAARPRLSLVLVGAGNVQGVARLAAETGLSAHVHTSGGFVDLQTLLDYYALADACVFPSWYEPFGLVATESMALGKPTILGTGFSRLFAGPAGDPAVRYIDPGDPADIARVVIEVMASPDRGASLGRSGARHAREQLSWARAAAATLALYGQVGLVSTVPRRPSVI